MLDVDRRPDVDAVVEQHADVLVALVAHRTGCVRVRQFVDDRDARAALDQPVDVDLRLGPATRAEAQERRALEPARALLGGDPPVRLEVADDEVGALVGGQTSVAEHLVGLADACGRAEVEAQKSAQLRGGGHGPSVGRARGSNRASLGGLQTLGRVLSGVFAARSYRRAMDFFAVALIVVLFAACAAFLAGIERL